MKVQPTQPVSEQAFCHERPSSVSGHMSLRKLPAQRAQSVVLPLAPRPLLESNPFLQWWMLHEQLTEMHRAATQ